MLSPKKGKRYNNQKSPFLWLCSARLGFLQFFSFFRWQLLNKQKHNHCFQALYNLFAIKHVEKRKRHVTKTHLVVERELLLVVLLHFQVTTLVFRLFLVALHVPQPTSLDDALLTLQLLQGRHHLRAEQVGPVA